MRRPAVMVKRSYGMLVASYYLSRCGDPGSNETMPPKKLNVNSWKAAYDLFFEEMGAGRSLEQFRNSMKNARDAFDAELENSRVGWINRKGRPNLPPALQRIHDEWRPRSDLELEEFVIRFLDGSSELEYRSSGFEARTEGGKKVYISTRRERDRKLRSDAINLHGYDCAVCGFNFEKRYGDVGSGFVEVHHMAPLAKSGETTNVANDLRVVCANCHRMIHRKQDICLTIEELQRHIANVKRTYDF
jgi:predicted HNH restriction endonuclease